MGLPQSSVSTESKSIAIEGLRKLRTGAIIFIVAMLLIVAALIAAIFAILAADFGGGAVEALMGLITIVGVATVGFILNWVGLFGFVIPGTSKLAEWDKKFSTSSKLLKIGYGGGAVLILIAIILIEASLGGSVLVIIGGIMLLVGYIGLIILSFKLNDTFNVTSIMVAGILFIIGIFVGVLQFIAWILMYISPSILFIIGIFVGVLQFIAWILMYVGLGSAIEKLEKGEI